MLGIIDKTIHYRIGQPGGHIQRLKTKVVEYDQVILSR
jgi:hypothetical protein